MINWKSSIRLLFTWLAVVGCACAVHAQQLIGGDEWIKAGQPYLKLTVSKKGIYHVAATDLFSKNAAFQGVDSRLLKLYTQGKEVYLYVSAGANATLLEADDFIEFYGERNDGAQDSLLFRDPYTGIGNSALQGNRRRSLFTDEAAYFLTWDASAFGLRYQQEITTSFGGAPEAFYRTELYKDFTNNFNLGSATSFDPSTTLNADYVTGEGFSGSYFDNTAGPDTNRNSKLFTTTHAYAAGTAPVVAARVMAATFTPHSLQLKLGSSTTTFSYSGIAINTWQFAGTVADVVGGSTTVTALSTSPSADQSALYYFTLQYDRQFVYDGEPAVDVHQWLCTAAAYLKFDGMQFAAVDSGFVFDLTSGQRIEGQVQKGGGNAGHDVLHVSFPTRLGTHHLFTVAASAMLAPDAITVPSFVNLADASSGVDFILLTVRDFTSSATAYKQYRDTCTVNPLSSKIVYLDEVVDEFGYGSITPLAIKRFIGTVLTRWVHKPRYVLIWSKAYTVVRGISAPQVPVWGYPASDREFGTNYDLGARDVTPRIAIGRVTIRGDDEGMAYLGKAHDYEHVPYDPWMKRALHLGGGLELTEQTQIANFFTQQVGPIYTGPPLLGTVLYDQKTSNNVVDNNVGSNIRTYIDEGCNILTFFGHAAANIFDINIEPVDVYNNPQRYPFIIANGCYSGNFTAGGAGTFGELFVKTANKGAIGYISMSGEGLIEVMAPITTLFYQKAFRDSLSASLGNLWKATLAETWATYNGNEAVKSHMQQLNMQGDPALVLRRPTHPDLSISAGQVFFDPSTPNAQADSFRLKLVVQNLGLALPDSFQIQLTQTIAFSNSVLPVPVFKHKMRSAVDTITVTIHRRGRDFSGQNFFDITLDPTNQVQEITKNNNHINVEKDFVTDLPALLYPWNFALLNQDTLSLQAGLYSLQQPGTVGYYFEIDTVPTFDSSFPDNLRKSPLIHGSSIFSDWRVPFSLQNNQVYYWRARQDLPTTTNRWSNGSFRYEAGTNVGWKQSRPAQFQANNFSTLAVDSVTKRFEFVPLSFLFSGYQTSNIFNKEFYLNGNRISGENSFREYAGSGIFYAPFDGNTLAPKLPTDPDMGNFNLISPSNVGSQLPAVIAALNPGDYLVLYGVGDPSGTTLWSDPSLAGAVAALQSIGISSAFASQPLHQRFVVYGRKGWAPGTAKEKYYAPGAGSQSDPLTYTAQVATAFGSMSSVPIGPAQQWGNLSFNWTALDAPINDTCLVDLYATLPSGKDSLLAMGITKNSSYSLASLNPLYVSNLKLVARMRNATTRLAPQLTEWQVTFTPPPDLALDVVNNYSFVSTTLDEGQQASIQLSERNISGLPMDSVQVVFTLTQATGRAVVLGKYHLAPTPVGGSLPIQFSFNTRGLGGADALQVALNPPPGRPERYRFNNYYSQAFTVKADQTSPVLDVTFDGRHLINDDVVSPHPLITIQVKDENHYLALSDTNSVQVFLKKISSTNAAAPSQRIAYSSGLLEFVPGQLPQNKALVRYAPLPLADGEYQLEVQGYDAKNNASGLNRYVIKFKVVNENTVTDVLNYPNPFSSSTRFVYTLTGTDLPEVFQIHIYTITGVMVKMIDLKALGEVFVGTNVTNYAWDGTDQYGDRLANGVYLYKVVMRMPSGKNTDHTDTGTSRYFKHGWGKMYLMR